MNNYEFLVYSASEPMKTLRKRFTTGKSLYKETPNFITKVEAMEDISYVSYVLEQAYSGYTYSDKLLFDKAFEAMESDVKKTLDSVTVNDLIDLIDLIADHLFFYLRWTFDLYYKRLRARILSKNANLCGRYFA